MVRASACLSGMSARQRARRSAPPSLTTSIARPSTYSSVPIGTLTTVNPSSSAVRTSTLSRSEISSAVGACPLGGWCHCFGGVDHNTSVIQLSLEEGECSNRVGRDPCKAERDIVHAREGFHSFSLDFLPESLQPRSRRQAGPLAGHGWSK